MIDVDNLKIVQYLTGRFGKQVLEIRQLGCYFVTFFDDDYVMLLVAEGDAITIDNAPSAEVRAKVKQMAEQINYPYQGKAVA